MPISADQLFDEQFHPQWMNKKALQEKWEKDGSSVKALNNFQWKLAAQESVSRISEKHSVRSKHE